MLNSCNYFSSDVPQPVATYWHNGYPAIGTEAENRVRAEHSGFEVLAVHRLPSQAWWDNYYSPLKENMVRYRDSDDETVQTVIKEIDEEMALFEMYSEFYGYSFYVLRAG
ncbi:MAG: hypothetical protein COB33_002020 [Thiotrichaceae bacterium]|nr:hypothetical protein [Thiotrichaceae bacterium]PCI12256.1 MAG: hypothetical protein COB71_09845 [Thiotrichales bacterium]